MARRDEPAHHRALENLLCPVGLEVVQQDALHVGAFPGESGHQDAASRKGVRPPMVVVSETVVGLRDLLRRPPRGRDAPETRARVRREDDRVVFQPRRASQGSRLAKGDGSAPRRRDLPQLSLGEETDPLPVRRKERLGSSLRPRQERGCLFLQWPDIQPRNAAALCRVRQQRPIRRNGERRAEIHGQLFLGRESHLEAVARRFRDGRAVAPLDPQHGQGGQRLTPRKAHGSAARPGRRPLVTSSRRSRAPTKAPPGPDGHRRWSEAASRSLRKQALEKTPDPVRVAAGQLLPVRLAVDHHGDERIWHGVAGECCAAHGQRLVSTHPKDQTSVRASSGLPRACSGLM